MKKIFKFAALAIVALTSTLSFSSCSNEDPLSDVAPATSQTAAATLNYYSDGSVKYTDPAATKVLANKLQSYLDENVGSLCTKVVADTAQHTKDMISIYVSISAPSKNEKALQAKLIEMQNNSSVLDDLVTATSNISYFSLNVKSYSNGSTVFAYSYSSKFSVQGTWEGTNKAGETVTVDIPGTKNKEGEMLASVTIGSQKYEGTMHSYGNNSLFYSNETGKDSYGATVNLVRVYLPLEDNNTVQGKILLKGQSMEKVTFNRK